MSQKQDKLHPKEVIPSTLILCENLAIIEDPRRKQAVRHPLIGVTVMALCAIAGGSDGWDDIADTASLHFDWFKEVVPCGNRPPSADTFRRIIQAIKPECFQKVLEAWLIRTALEKRPGRQICFDGKALKGSKQVHIVNAFDPNDCVILGQVSVGEKENEISALPALQEMLELSGTICTGDAMFTQKSIVESLQDSGADYLLALKGNQPSFFERVQNEFAGNFASILQKEEVEKNKGWIEVRTLKCSTRIKKVDPQSQWKGLQTVLELKTEKFKGEKFSIETRYFISSLPSELSNLLSVIRSHWGIENGLHRTLDIYFKEDACQVRDKTGAANLSIMRKIAGSILHQLDPDKTLKSKIKAIIGSSEFRWRFLSCDWD
jgi:predicted transposase YbfD/YdcC